MTTLEKSLKRLDDLADLPDGWLDGIGVSQDPMSIAQARRFAELFYRFEGASPVRFYPSEEGVVQAEWSIGGWSIDLPFTNNIKLVAQATHVDGAEEEYPVSLHLESGGVGDLVEWLRSLA